MKFNVTQKLFLLILCAVLSNSCKHDIIQNDKTIAPEVSWAKDYFTQRLEGNNTISVNTQKIMSMDEATEVIYYLYLELRMVLQSKKLMFLVS